MFVIIGAHQHMLPPAQLWAVDETPIEGSAHSMGNRKLITLEGVPHSAPVASQCSKWTGLMVMYDQPRSPPRLALCARTQHPRTGPRLARVDQSYFTLLRKSRALRASKRGTRLPPNLLISEITPPSTSPDH